MSSIRRLGPASVAARLAVNVRTLSNYVAAGILDAPAYFNGRRVWTEEQAIACEARLAARSPAFGLPRASTVAPALGCAIERPGIAATDAGIEGAE